MVNLTDSLKDHLCHAADFQMILDQELCNHQMGGQSATVQGTRLASSGGTLVENGVSLE